MKLKENIPIYNIGDTVTIIDDFSRRHRGDLREVGINATMVTLAGNRYTIQSVSGGRYRLNEVAWQWSVNLFKESYDFEEKDITEPYVGMYMYHDGYKDGKLLFRLTEINKDGSYMLYFIDRRYDNPHTLDPNILANFKHPINAYSDTDVRLGCLFGPFFIPSNDELMKQWGITNKTINKQEPLGEGMLPIPNLFGYSKYPIKRLTGIRTNGNTYAGYVFQLHEDLRIGYNGTKYENIKLDTVFGNKSLGSKEIKDLLMEWGKAKIKSFEQSVEIFGHKTRKGSMFEASSTKPPTIYKINNIIFNYEKEGKYYHVIEVNDGTLNLKFLLDDVELILPNVNNYVLPKDRKIILKSECKVIKDKLLPVTKGTKVKVEHMYNRHTPLKGAGTFDRNTICVVSNGINKFECKVKQLKKI